MSVSRHFLLQAPQCPCSVRKRFSRDHCCPGRSKPGCRIVGSHTRSNNENLGKSAITFEEPEDKNPHFLYTCLIIDLMTPLMRLLVNCRSSLTHASHCMTTSWPAAATQTRVRISPTMHTMAYLSWTPFLLQLSLFLGLGKGSEYAALSVY